MRRLAGVPELLDGPLEDPAALRGNLRDLARINRWLGGTVASRRAVEALVPAGPGPVTLLDVGTGAADIPLALADDGRAGRPLIRVTAVDARDEVLAAALDVTPALRHHARVRLAVADGRSLAFDDGAFDVVHASLLLHHLEPEEAIAFLREAARVARLGVVVNDLVRARMHWLGAKLLLGVATRNRYTRHDGPLSVRRAYTRVELRALLAAAGLRPVAEATAFVGHRVALAAMAIPGAGTRGR